MTTPSARLSCSVALLLAAAAFIAGCNHDGDVLSGDMNVADDPGFNLDAFLSLHDGGYPDGFVLPPTADGGVVVNLPDGGTAVCYVTPCQGKVYACGNCTDDDGDGLVDSFDPDCLGPCQNNEAGFYGNIPGQNNAPCKSDCYWDQDTGSGNDQCHWSHSCDPLEQGGAGFAAGTAPEIGCTYDPNAKIPGASVPGGQKACEYLRANQDPICQSYCGALTPNGCDCFGCCEDPNRKGQFVYAGSVNGAGSPSCTSNAATLADPTLCKPCTPVLADSGCFKPCGECELCFGKTTLPMKCYMSVLDMAGAGTGTDFGGSPPPQSCPSGEAACGLAGQSPCPPGNYCISGCCAVIIL